MKQEPFSIFIDFFNLYLYNHSPNEYYQQLSKQFCIISWALLYESRPTMPTTKLLPIYVVEDDHYILYFTIPHLFQSIISCRSAN